ncbi:MAG: TrmB family transcriptional regulator [Candidatus Woesearchaeota archaeon]
MNEDILLILENYGLSKTEAIIYLTLLRKGELTAYRISKEAKLYKANTYQAVETLIKKGIASEYVSEGKSLIKVLPPEELVNNLERQKEQLQNIIPLMDRGFDSEEGITILKGVKSFMNALYGMLAFDKDILVFDIPRYVPEIVGPYIMHFHKERLKKKVNMYHIYDYDAGDRIKFLSKMKYTYAKKGIVDRASTISTLVCGDVTLIVNWTKEVKTIMIKDKDVAEAYKGQFDMLWNK